MKTLHPHDTIIKFVSISLNWVETRGEKNRGALPVRILVRILFPQKKLTLQRQTAGKRDVKNLE